jgi:hypothetical protein
VATASAAAAAIITTAAIATAAAATAAAARTKTKNNRSCSCSQSYAQRGLSALHMAAGSNLGDTYVVEECCLRRFGGTAALQSGGS